MFIHSSFICLIWVEFYKLVWASNSQGTLLSTLSSSSSSSSFFGRDFYFFHF
ncbi:MAG: hypothetical protein ACKPKO_49600 [Candidatus Fonsibacter sp.]